MTEKEFISNRKQITFKKLLVGLLTLRLYRHKDSFLTMGYFIVRSL